MPENEATILYRTFSGENNAPRPDWYSKELCLKSMLLSYEHLKEHIPTTFTVLFDGQLNLQDEWSKELKRLVEPRGLIIERSHQGNCESTINASYKASEQPENNTVIIAEDDYLWLAPALIGIHHSLTQLPIHYST